MSDKARREAFERRALEEGKGAIARASREATNRMKQVSSGT
jgi:hypothetical protein